VRWGVCAVAVVVLAGDQVSKSLVLAARPGPSGGGVVSVRLVRNTGASFGLGAGHPIVVVLVAVAIIAIVAVLLARTRSRAAALCLAAVLGGALGNLADRLFRAPGLGRGAVVDWIHVAVYPATFNIADLAIRVGAVGAVIAMLDIRVRGGSWRARRARRARAAAPLHDEVDEPGRS
jgi:signal peptidase II